MQDPYFPDGFTFELTKTPKAESDELPIYRTIRTLPVLRWREVVGFGDYGQLFVEPIEDWEPFEVELFNAWADISDQLGDRFGYGQGIEQLILLRIKEEKAEIDVVLGKPMAQDLLNMVKTQIAILVNEDAGKDDASHGFSDSKVALQSKLNFTVTADTTVEDYFSAIHSFKEMVRRSEKGKG